MEEGPLSKSRFEALTYKYPRFYPQKVKDFTLDDNLPLAGLTIRNEYRSKAAKFGLGTLDVLPLELLQESLSHLDVSTLTKFRHINRRAADVVESIPEFKAIVMHAPNALLGILSVETGHLISCKALYEQLCTAECEHCGSFAGYLYVLTCSRVCFHCFTAKERYLPLRYCDARRKFGIDRKILKTLPSMRSIPGKYSREQLNRPKRLVLVDSGSAYRAGVALHGSPGAMRRYASHVYAQELQEHNIKAFHASANGTYLPRHLYPHDAVEGNPLRFMGIIRMPWLNRATREPEYGAYCIGCISCHDNCLLNQFDIQTLSHHANPVMSLRRIYQRLHRRLYTEASFSEHLRQYGDIRDRKHIGT
ncbi:hypothetical protein BU24DRAFT_412267 [Aaosphaeria arxii CBS 175.79]|uniref:F-box domain-containing protein n=1 Tax=Aaosphaeria arxii CBS 175.79 TaxID=1450172 RepID=A0A6A5XI85_9PLEO|nr:uncharacterized protein BU24DRAFT_412267 [Aaosphaeria arxii CBS 175.79]KAF2012958.1 hypothetical protein BU24DRAFT_412267 [Aaosphaeria arxii CBS 175.79]